MKKEVTLGQLLATGVGLLVTIITAWITITNRVTVLESENKYYKEKIQKLEGTTDAIQRNTIDILIKLEQKQNRNP